MINDELCRFLFELGLPVVEGIPHRTPYPDKINGEGYITFGSSQKQEGESHDIFDSPYAAMQSLREVISTYANGKKRIIMRRWPELRRVEYPEDSAAHYLVSCRLLADDGEKELAAAEEIISDIVSEIV